MTDFDMDDPLDEKFRALEAEVEARLPYGSPEWEAYWLAKSRPHRENALAGDVFLLKGPQRTPRKP